MADIVLKTFRGGSVTPQDDATIHQTVIATNGIFKGCQISYSRGNVLHLSQGFGMIKGRFFEIYDTEIPIELSTTGEKLKGRIYIHLDLSNADEPIQILTQTATVLGVLTGDEDINYNNTTYDMELATFSVTNTALLDLVQTSSKITGASSGGSASSLQRLKHYDIGDFATCGSAPEWVTLYCTKSGETAAKEPAEYSNLAQVGDIVQDGTCTSIARDVIGELDIVKDLYTDAAADIEKLQEELMNQIDNLPPPVGTIKYSASADLGEEWLRCDGSFISELDYPELVAALGKLTPGVDELTVLHKDSTRGQVSNCVIFDEMAWIYIVGLKKLIGFTEDGTKKELEVQGADMLQNYASSPVILSLCGQSMYLAQDAQSKFTFLECAVCDLNGDTIQMTDCTEKLATFLSSLSYRDLVYPSISDIDGIKYMTIGTASSSSEFFYTGTSYSSDFMNVLVWTAGSIEDGTKEKYEFRLNKNSTNYGYFSKTVTEHMSRTLLRFHEKNDGEFVLAYTEIQARNGDYDLTGYAAPYSVPRGLYGLDSNVKNCPYDTETWEENGTTWTKFYNYDSGENYSLSINTLAVSAENECLYSVQIIDGKLWLMH